MTGKKNTKSIITFYYGNILWHCKHSKQEQHTDLKDHTELVRYFFFKLWYQLDCVLNVLKKPVTVVSFQILKEILYYH